MGRRSRSSRIASAVSPSVAVAAQELPALAARHDRLLRWRPIELAKVWEEQGVLEAYKAVRRAKGRYVMRDAARVAAERGVSFVPFRSLPDATAARLVVHRLNRCAPAAAQPFLLEVWRKLFAEGADIGSSEVLACCLDPHLHPEIERRASGRLPDLRPRRGRARPLLRRDCALLEHARVLDAVVGPARR